MTAPNNCPKPIVNTSYKRPVLSIFFQLDPRNPTIGGIQTCIKYVIKYAPPAFRIQLIGITDQASEVGKWQAVRLYGREFKFLPLLQVADDNVRGFIPTTMKYAWALRKYLRKRPLTSDLYQFHRIEPTLFTKRLTGTKLLYIHNDIYQEVKGGQKGGILWKRFPWLYFALERRLVSQFNRILSCNSESVSLYQQQYPEIAQRVSYLRNTFDSELFYPPQNKVAARNQLSKRLSLPEGRRFILFAGRLHPQKQPLLLVQAMAQLQAQLKGSLPMTPETSPSETSPSETAPSETSPSETAPNSLAATPICPHLIVVGKGELERQVRNEVSQLGLSSHVTFLGPMPQSELADLYRACDVFALTSAYEGLARGSLEALACGTPIVTTRAGETPKFLEPDSGIVCDRPTPRGIAQCWHTVLTQPAQFPASACLRVAAPYEAQQVVETLYGDLLTHWHRQHQRYPDPNEPPHNGYARRTDGLHASKPALADTRPSL
ncbi:MAG: glycosyltransferase family 4 protein [Phormidesmis sp.]